MSKLKAISLMICGTIIFAGIMLSSSLITSANDYQPLVTGDFILQQVSAASTPHHFSFQANPGASTLVILESANPGMGPVVQITDASTGDPVVLLQEGATAYCVRLSAGTESYQLSVAAPENMSDELTYAMFLWTTSGSDFDCMSNEIQTAILNALGNNANLAFDGGSDEGESLFDMVSEDANNVSTVDMGDNNSNGNNGNNDNGNNGNDDGNNPEEPSISEEEAITIALEIFPNSTITRVVLEDENGILMWDINFDDNTRSVDVNSETGAVEQFGYEINDDDLNLADSSADDPATDGRSNGGIDSDGNIEQNITLDPNDTTDAVDGIVDGDGSDSDVIDDVVDTVTGGDQGTGDTVDIVTDADDEGLDEIIDDTVGGLVSPITGGD